MIDPPIQHPLVPGHPRACLARGTGQWSDPDEAFNLCQRIYPPDIPVCDPVATSSPSSIRLLATEEGVPREGETVPIREPPEEGFQGQACLALPHHHYESQMNRDRQLQDQPIYLGPHGPPSNGMYGVDTRFGYERMPYHIGIDPLWYDPGRGSHYRAYPQYILPPPFGPHHYLGHPNEPLPLQVGAMGRGHHTHPPPPLRGPHATEYTLPSGDRREPSTEAHRQAPPYNQTPSSAEAGLGLQEDTNHSAEVTITRPEDPET